MCESKYLKKIIAVFLSVQICLLMVSAETRVKRDVGNFKDVSSDDWYYVYVERLYENGIINGVTADSYDPDSEVKTSEVAALIARYLGLEHTAEVCREFLIKNNIEGASLWYSGYIQVMCDTGIFDEGEIAHYGVKLMATGGAVISSNASLIIDYPIKRMDMIKFIAKSFEIKKYMMKSNGLLKKEISGNGNEFINGGGYDINSLRKIRNMISDYDSIPEDYQEYFLKCYYNGIVRGNERSEVLPYNNLRRSELAKIIAAVMYFELRGDEIRDIPGVCVITSRDYIVSSIDGAWVLKKEKAEQILREQAKNIKTESLADSVSVLIGQQNIIPKGYLYEAYIYRYENGVSYEIGRLNCSTNTTSGFPKETSFVLSKSGVKASSDFVGYIYIILRDLNKSGEVVGAVMFDIDAVGNLKDAQVYYR